MTEFNHLFNGFKVDLELESIIFLENSVKKLKDVKSNSEDPGKIINAFIEFIELLNKFSLYQSIIIDGKAFDTKIELMEYLVELGLFGCQLFEKVQYQSLKHIRETIEEQCIASIVFSPLHGGSLGCYNNETCLYWFRLHTSLYGFDALPGLIEKIVEQPKLHLKDKELFYNLPANGYLEHVIYLDQTNQGRPICFPYIESEQTSKLREQQADFSQKSIFLPSVIGLSSSSSFSSSSVCITSSIVRLARTEQYDGDTSLIRTLSELYEMLPSQEAQDRSELATQKQAFLKDRDPKQAKLWFYLSLHKKLLLKKTVADSGSLVTDSVYIPHIVSWGHELFDRCKTNEEKAELKSKTSLGFDRDEVIAKFPNLQRGENPFINKLKTEKERMDLQENTLDDFKILAIKAGRYHFLVQDYYASIEKDRKGPGNWLFRESEQFIVNLFKVMKQSTDILEEQSSSNLIPNIMASDSLDSFTDEYQQIHSFSYDISFWQFLKEKLLKLAIKVNQYCQHLFESQADPLLLNTIEHLLDLLIHDIEVFENFAHAIEFVRTLSGCRDEDYQKAFNLSSQLVSKINSIIEQQGFMTNKEADQYRIRSKRLASTIDLQSQHYQKSSFEINQFFHPLRSYSQEKTKESAVQRRWVIKFGSDLLSFLDAQANREDLIAWLTKQNLSPLVMELKREENLTQDDSSTLSQSSSLSWNEVRRKNVETTLISLSKGKEPLVENMTAVQNKHF